jgi:hypothetical protein
MRIPRSIRNSLFASVVLLMSAASFAQIGIGVSVRFGPPPLPVYEQPLCPGDGYLWTPGYWAYGDDGYYWVPGTWVLAPEPGFLWTPGYWGWGGAAFVFHEGYWGPHVGFYGGINYGFGFFGVGFQGGRWDGGHFFYNRAVMNVNVTNIHNVYNTTIINNNVNNHVAFNGGEGGIQVHPNSEEMAAEHERHLPPTSNQVEHVNMARSNPQLRASVNQGRPPIAATARPTEFSGHDVVPARAAGGEYHAPAEAGRPGEAAHPENNVPRPPAHASEVQPHAAPERPNTGDAARDQKYQQQQQKLVDKQNQEHQKLQQKQDQEHQKLAQRNASEAQKSQVEQKHQQQTQQMEARHTQQQQHLQQRQSGRR